MRNLARKLTDSYFYLMVLMLALFSIENMGRKLVTRRERGAVETQNFILIAVGFVLVVFASVMSRIVIDTAATTGAQANIGSFSGTRSMNDLTPFVIQGAVVLIGVGMMGVGAFKAFKGK